MNKLSFQWPLLFIFLFSTHVFSSETKQDNKASETSPLKVVASFSILGDMVAALGGESVSVSNLTPIGQTAQHYTPSAEQLTTLANADLFVVNGFGYDDWSQGAIDEAGFKGSLLIATTGMRPEQVDNQVDPMAWQSPVNALVYAINISTILVELLPEKEEFLQEKLAIYLGELVALDDFAIETFSGLSREQRIFVTSHEGFNYLASAYTLSFIPLAGTDPKDQRVDTYSELAKQMKKLGIDTIFLNQVSQKTASEKLATLSGAKINNSVYSETLSEQNGPASSYLNMMRHNIQQFANSAKKTEE